MKVSYTLALICLLLSACAPKPSGHPPELVQTAVQEVELPEPFETKSVYNFSRVIGWPEGVKPIAPPGFSVRLYADNMQSARWMYPLPNGDVLVSQANTEHKGLIRLAGAFVGLHRSGNTGKSPNKITLLRDTNGDGLPDFRSDFLTGLNKPFGMLLLGDSLYVAVTDGVYIFPYTNGDTAINATGRKIMDLPEGGYNHHWTRNIIVSPDSSKLYISVGSASNVGEYGLKEEERRACILEINPDGSGERIFASGLRNPVGMDFAPLSNDLWTAVNERDRLGDELVPDYATSVKDGGFYGWPFYYFGDKPDPRFSDEERPKELKEQSLIPDVALGSHTASLGLAFYRHERFPEYYHKGAFIAQHGSWNRSELNGYKVIYIPFKDGKVSGPPEDFLTGFIHNLEKQEVYGRPVGVAFLQDGSMLMTDDGSNVIWQVIYEGP